jgi:hypothetical protein
MHDLNTITRLNAQAFADSIASYRAKGKFVLAKYEGLHLASIETFDDQRAAQVAFDTIAAKRDPSGRTVLFAPLQAHEVIGKRDQSEDRTLRDYIARKEGSTGGVPVAQVNEN